MAKVRKRHTQVAMEFKTWGGKRKGAGRPPKGSRPSEPHAKRARFSRMTPVHVTMRVVAAVGALRRRDAYHAIRRAMYPILARSDFRIVHLSLENDHIHAIVEADHEMALARGLQAFESAAAQRLNRAISEARGVRRRGTVFVDRYHARLITSPTQAHHTLAYVLNNWRRHKQDRGLHTRFWNVDYFSSGPSFGGWKELDGDPLLYAVLPSYSRLSVARPQTWLLDKGWRLAGEIRMHDVPGPIG